MLLCYIALMKVHPFEQLILKIIFIWGKKWGGITIFLYQKKMINDYPKKWLSN